MAITKKPTAQERASARAVYKDLRAQYKEDRDAARETYRGARAEARTLPAAERNEMRNKALEEYKTAREKSFGDQRSAYDAYKSSASPKKPQTGQAAPTSPKQPDVRPSGKPNYDISTLVNPGKQPTSSGGGPRTTIDPNAPRRPAIEGGMRPPGGMKTGGAVGESAMMKKEGRGMAKANMQKIAGAAVKKHEKAMHGMKSGGMASKRADGIAQRGKTRCKIC